jgi:hypothetical protein
MEWKVWTTSNRLTSRDTFVEEASDETMLVFDRKKGAKAKDKPVAKRRRVSK